MLTGITGMNTGMSNMPRMEAENGMHAAKLTASLRQQHLYTGLPHRRSINRRLYGHEGFNAGCLLLCLIA